MGRIEAGEIGDARQIGGVVDGDDDEIPSRNRLRQGTQETTPDPAIPIDGNPQGAQLAVHHLETCAAPERSDEPNRPATIMPTAIAAT